MGLNKQILSFEFLSLNRKKGASIPRNEAISSLDGRCPSWDGKSPSLDERSPSWDGKSPSWDGRSPSWDGRSQSWDGRSQSLVGEVPSSGGDASPSDASKYFRSGAFTPFIFALIVALFGCLNASAQPTADIGLYNSGSDTLVVKLTPRGFFNGIVSNVVFAIRWETGCNTSLGNIIQTGSPATYIPMVKSGGTKVSNGYTYQVFGGTGIPALSTMGISWANGVPITLLKMKVNNPKGTFEIINNSWTATATNNADFFISLNGLKKTGVIIQDKYSFITTGSRSICQGDSILLGGVYRKTPGTYSDILQGAGGCDSTVLVTLSVTAANSITKNISICQGQSYFAGGAWRTTSGTYIDNLSHGNGCDSILITNLTVKPTNSSTRTVNICQGQSYFVGGAWRSASGTFTDHYTNHFGCDSTSITILKVNPKYTNHVYYFFCQGASVIAGGDYQTQSGTFYDTLASRFGCDSVIVTHLTIETTIHFPRNVTVCNGNGIFAGGAFRTVSGTYRDTFRAVMGCDSVVTTNLTVLPAYSSSRMVSICQGEKYFAGGAWRTTSGTYTDVVTSHTGCDSTITTTLTVLQKFSSSRQVQICNGEELFAGGANQYSSGTYFDTLTARNGCDSVVSTFLTVLPRAFKNVSVMMCEGNSYFAGGSWRTMAGYYYDTLVAANGCDSIVITHITILQKSAKDVFAEICQGESYFAGGAYRTTAGIYYDYLLNDHGCDSVVTTHLSIYPVKSSTTNVSICAGDSYFAGGTFRTAAGTYRDTLSTSHGCDSIIITILNVLPNSQTVRSISICQGQGYFAGGAFRTISGTYYDTLPAANGCDSIVETILMVNPTPAASITSPSSICVGGNATLLASGGTAYLWNTGLTTSFIVVSPAATTSYSVTVTNGSGCTASASATVIVNPLPVAFISPLNVSICSGSSANLNASGGSNYLWSTSATTASITVSPTTITAYSVTVTNSNGCTATASRDVNVNALPVVAIAPSSVTICSGSNATLTASGGLSYLWSTGVTTPSITVNPASATSYSVTATDANSCSAFGSRVVEVNPKKFTTKNAAICQGGSYYAGGGLQTHAGTYYDTLSSTVGCDSIITTNLSIRPTVYSYQNITSCPGESVWIGRGNQTIAGTYYDTLASSRGCDSIVITQLAFFVVDTTFNDILIHQGESYYAGGAAQTTNGIYYDTLESRYHCDSIVITNLAVVNILSDITVNTVNNTLTIRTTLEKSYADNTYGANAIGWEVPRTIDSLVISDNLHLALFDVNGEKKLDFKLDYLSHSTEVPTGYKSLGIQGGEGGVLAGDESKILSTATSIDKNLNTLGYALINASPSTDTSYTPNPSYPDWIFDVWYEAKIDLSIFSNAGYGYRDIVSVHASPDKADKDVFVESDSLIPPGCPRTETKTIIICEGDSFFVGGAYQTVPGTYYDILTTSGGCDIFTVSRLSVLPVPVTDIYANICQGENYFAGGAPRSDEGIYRDTLGAASGCDSIVVTHLTVNPIHWGSVHIGICQGESYFAGGTSQTSSGIYYDTLPSATGCDSVVITHITVVPRIYYSNTLNACPGERVYAGGDYQTFSGIYYDTLIAASGCDSVLITHLNFYAPAVININVSICEGESYFAGGANQNSNGVYYDTLTSSHQCDSVIITQLAVLPVYNTVRNISICQGESYYAEGNFQQIAGIYFDTLISANGCDSIIETRLSVFPVYSKNIFTSICAGESYFAGGVARTTAGIYTDRLTTFHGCDSTIITHLSVLPNRQSARFVSICTGDSSFAEGAFRKVSGIYRDTVTALNGCDSVVVTSLAVEQIVTKIVEVGICAGDSFFVGGNYQTATGNYYDTLQGSRCDSIVITSLTILEPETKIILATICSNETYFAQGAYQDTAGIYRDTLQAASGCDSMVITVLHVMDIAAENRSVSICSGDSLFAEGKFQNSSGTYYDTFIALNGCDSILTTQLTVIPPSIKIIEVTICNSENYLAGGALQSVSGIYYDTTLSASGCDSVIITMLTVNPAFSVSRDIFICNGDSFFAGGEFRGEAGLYQDSFQSAGGCDSIVTTYLNIYPTHFSQRAIRICEGDSFFVAGKYQTIAGYYSDTFTNHFGCDSIVGTNLAIGLTVRENRDIAICQGDSFYAGGAYRLAGGIYYDTLTASAGCDSIVITHLSISSILSESVFVQICDGDSIYAGGKFQHTAGTYVDTLVSNSGCDSLIITNLSLLPVKLDTVTVTICSDVSYFAGGALQNASGIYDDTLTAASGCDSVVITNLSVNPVYSVSQEIFICNGDSFFAGGNFRQTAGVYKDTFYAATGCDSIISTTLNIHPANSDERDVFICEGDSFFAAGKYQTIAGYYSDTLINRFGCDSINNTNIIVGLTIRKSTNVTICAGDSFFTGGAYQQNAGIYSDTLIAESGCDSIKTTHLSISTGGVGNFSIQICEGDSVYAGGKHQHLAGTYFDTLSAIGGCDSIVITHLSVIPMKSDTIAIAICSNESYRAGGALQNTSGIYFDTLIASSGCDSVIVTELAVNPVYSFAQEIFICSGDSFLTSGSFKHTEGLYYDTLQTAAGCDSVLITNLKIHPNHLMTVDARICEDDSFFAGGRYKMTAGYYLDTLSNRFGCDSIVRTNLTVQSNIEVNINQVICEGDSLFAEGDYQYSAGIYYDTLSARAGCDSIIITSLTVNPRTYKNIQVSICAGESLYVGGSYQSNQGIYNDTFVSASGCDSIVITSLEIVSSKNDTVHQEICSGESYFAGGALRATGGVYQDTFIAASGCDSIVTTILTVSPSSSSLQQIFICSNDSFFVAGKFRHDAGFYYDTLPAANGCDSILTTDLKIYPTYFNEADIQICEGDSFLAGNSYQRTSGYYLSSLSNRFGCDSIVEINLVVASKIYTSVNATICSGDSLFAGGAYQNAAGNYFDTSTAATGCDSITITSLSIKPTILKNISLELCAGDSFFAKGDYQTRAGTYYDTLIAANGCDSIVITQLSIRPRHTHTVEVEICNGENYFAGGTLQVISGTYYDTFTASDGCDSILITILTVNPTYSFTHHVSICSNDSFFAGGEFRSVAGLYYDTLQTTEGCDSILVTDLKIHPDVFRIVAITICEGESYYAGNAYQYSSGTYFDTLKTDANCDSIIQTELLVNDAIIENIDIQLCAGDSIYAGGSFRKTSGIYHDALQSQIGCDSILTTTVSVLPKIIDTVHYMICSGQRVFVHGAWRNSNGTYYDTLIADSGCDSIVVSKIEVFNVLRNTVSVNICQGESYYAGGAMRTTSGLYRDTFTSSYGCDSIVTTKLKVNPRKSSYNPVTICRGQSYFAGGQMQTIPGIYLDTLVAANGCDSVRLTILNVRPFVTSNIQVVTCSNEPYFAGGAYRTIAGIYHDTLTNAAGCDSILTTVLNITPSYFIRRDVSICSGEALFLQGAYRTTSGQFTDTFTARNLCDSIVVTNLFIKNLSFSSRIIKICEGENFFVGGNYQTESGSYVDTFISSKGCDSILTTQLVAFPLIITNRNQAICEGSGLFVGGAFQTTAGIYYDTLLSSNGCDSVIATDLMVIPTQHFSNNISICDGESYFAGGLLRTTAGNYYDTLVAQSGCDSVVSTHINILPHYSEIIPVSICSNETYFATGAYQNAEGLYYDTLMASNGCDSVIITDLKVLPAFATSISAAICAHEAYFAGGDYQNISGTYDDTFTAVNGCDSVVTTILTVLPDFTFTNKVSICKGDSFFAGRNYQTISGTYQDTFVAFNGCDSIVITQLTVIAPTVTNVMHKICEGEGFYAGGALQTTAGIYYDTLVTSLGCDSVIQTDLVVIPTKYSSVNISICDGESYFAGGILRTTTGEYYDTLLAQTGCDSVVHTHLNVLPSYSKIIPVTICSNETYFAGGAYQNIDGLYNDTLTAINGCDSIIITDLHVLPVHSTYISATICAHEKYFAGGSYQNTTGTYYDTLTSANSCDSVVVTELLVLSDFISINPVTICEGESFFAEGAWQSTPGIYYDTLTALNGCDSAIITQLIVLPVKTTSLDAFICTGEYYFVQGALQNVSGTYYDILLSADGCDSIVTTQLSVLPKSLDTIDVEICSNGSYFAQGTYRNLSGTYYDTLQAQNGCDSIVITRLTVLPAKFSAVNVSICPDDFYFAGGKLRNTNGTYYDTLAAANSCDSIVSTHLTILNTAVTNINAAICQGESYYTGGAYQTVAGSYFDTLNTSTGCDSIIITNLSVKPFDVIIQNVSICDDAVYYAGGMNQNTSGTYFDTLLNHHGCDSIIITNLVVFESVTATIYKSLCEGESYYAGGSYQTVSGTYRDTFSNHNSCDSIVITHLTILPKQDQLRMISICNNDSIYLQKAYQHLPGIFIDTFTSANGCDSIVTTQLSLKPAYVVYQYFTICSNENIFLGGFSRNVSGTYYDTLTAVNGCDSTVVSYLTVLPTSSSSQTFSFCEGDSLFIAGAYRTASGSHTDRLFSANGCDSVATFSWVVNPTPVANAGNDQTICEGETVTLSALGGNTYLWNNLDTAATISILPANTVSLIVTATNTFDCSDMDTVIVFVNPLPIVSFIGLDTTYCNRDENILLTGTPPGGQFDGVGISGSSFNPVSLSAGSYVIKYTYVNVQGCEAESNASVRIKDSPLATITGLNSTYCNETISNLLTGFPAGGVFSGAGITGSTFTPSDAGVGGHNITYLFESTEGCASVDTEYVTVLNVPKIDFEITDTVFCITDDSVVLRANPLGGTFSGAGIIDSFFHPVLAGVGNYPIKYESTLPNGCSSFVLRTVEVRNNPYVAIAPMPPGFCPKNNPVTLKGFPSGGSFLGGGFTHNVFNPATAGPGEHLISYAYTDEFNCSDTATTRIVVYDSPSATLRSLSSQYCTDASPVQVNVSPAGGILSGKGWDPLESTCRHASLSIL